MADITIPFGKDAVVYYGKADGTQPLDEDKYFLGVKDVTVTMEKDEADASRRAFPGWHDHRVGMKNLRVSFDIAGTTIDTVGGITRDGDNEVDVIDILRILFLTDLYDTATGIALYIRSTGVDPATGNGEDYVGEGVWGEFLCTKFDRNEPLNDLQTYSVEMVMTLIHGTTPTWADNDPS